MKPVTLLLTLSVIAGILAACAAPTPTLSPTAARVPPTVVPVTMVPVAGTRLPTPAETTPLPTLTPGETVMVLAKPFTANQGGIYFDVNQLLADSDQTSLTYILKGISRFAFDRGNKYHLCDAAQNPELRLPDGHVINDGVTLDGSGGSDGGPTFFDQTVHYSGLPAGTSQVTVVISCIYETPELGPVNWEISIPLVAAPKDSVTPIASRSPASLGSLGKINQ